MLNLLYASFPFGNAEIFVEYEIPYLNELLGNQYRVFSFYKGKSLSAIKKNDVLGEVYLVRPFASDYIKALITLLGPSFFMELMPMKNRECRDSLVKCLWRLLNYRAYGYALKKKIRTIGITDNEVFVSYWLNECAYAAISLKDKQKSIKVVSRAHGFDVFEDRCYLPYRNELFGNIDRVYTINRVEKKYLLDRYNHRISEDRISVSHLGISISEYFSLKDSRSHFTIVTCSSIIPLKRLDLLIEALSEIKEFSFKWIHIGGGPLQEQIAKLAETKLSSKNQEYVFLGQVSLAQVHEFYNNNEISLFVNCSDTEGVPVSIMEAMSYGIPAVVRDVGGVSEIVDDNDGIILRSECTSDELADAIRRIYFMSNEEYIAKRRAARRKIENEFNAYYQYRSFFKEVMEPLTK